MTEEFKDLREIIDELVAVAVDAFDMVDKLRQENKALNDKLNKEKQCHEYTKKSLYSKIEKIERDQEDITKKLSELDKLENIHSCVANNAENISNRLGDICKDVNSGFCNVQADLIHNKLDRVNNCLDGICNQTDNAVLFRKLEELIRLFNERCPATQTEVSSAESVSSEYNGPASGTMTSQNGG